MSTTAEQTTIPTGTWELDPIHSSVGFAVTYSGAGTVRGGFDDFDAKLVDGKLEGSAKVASVNFDEPQLVGHLQSPDFFDAEQFPELRFTSKPIERNGDEITVEGELTLRGVTKPVDDLRHGRRPDAGCRGCRTDPADRVRRRDQGRPPRVRHQLEQGAADRRSRARQRREDHRQPRAVSGGVVA